MRRLRFRQDDRIGWIDRTKTPFPSIQSSILLSCLKIFIGFAALVGGHPALAGVAVFSGQEDEVRLQAEGLTRVTALNNAYLLTGGSVSFDDACTGPVNEHVAIKENVISELNPKITSLLGTSDWEITLQIDPISGGIRTDGIAGTVNPSGQAYGIGIVFGNGFNQRTSASGQGNLRRGGAVFFGFDGTSLWNSGGSSPDLTPSAANFPVLSPFALVIGADDSDSEESRFFNFFSALDFTADQETPLFFQDFVGTHGKITLSRKGVDEFGRPVITIGSGSNYHFSTWAWTGGETGTPGPPVVNANFAPFGLASVGESEGGFGSQNINFNGLIPAEAAPPGSTEPVGMPVTNIFLFVENETTWEEYLDPILPDDPSHRSDDCFGTEPGADESELYNIEFGSPADGSGEINSNDSVGLRARLTGPRDDINSYGAVEIQNAIPASAGRFACLTIVSDAIPDINPNSACLGPTITTQPAALTTIDLRTQEPPQNISLSVAAIASGGSLSYQWKKDGTAIRALVGSAAGPIRSGAVNENNAGAGSLAIELPGDGVAIVSQTWTLVMTGDNETSPTQADFSLTGSVTGPAFGPVSSDEGDEFIIAGGIKFFVTQDNTDASTRFQVGDEFRVPVAALPVVNATADNSTFSIVDVDRDDSGIYTVCVTDDNRTIESNDAVVTILDFPPNAARSWREYD